MCIAQLITALLRSGCDSCGSVRCATLSVPPKRPMNTSKTTVIASHVWNRGLCQKRSLRDLRGGGSGMERMPVGALVSSSSVLTISCCVVFVRYRGVL